ncbi:hypothetical protein [Bradyrhizobium sp. B120]|uniref:hypothetical protein n=1 Tax=Bradyrhizobium sp. B120 TaxID=3410088 RepID=UPI003B985933
MAMLTENLKQNYAKAEAALAASIGAAERFSKKRLSALLALAPQERFDHLADRSLTPADALALTRSLRVETRPRPRKQVSVSMSRSLRRLSMATLMSPASIAILVMAAVYAVVVWLHTPREATVTQPVEVTVQYPDGRLVNGMMSPGKIWWLIRSYGDHAIIRIWMPMTGYQEFDVPASVVQLVR